MSHAHGLIGLFAILAGARIRFVVACGLALVLRGPDRLTADVDPVIDVVIRIGDHEVSVACVEHLIRMKEAAGRPQDLADVERLRARLEG